MLTRIYHKKNELFQIEFYQDEKCTNLIKDLPYSENAKKSDISNFYIELKEGDITPITFLLKLSRSINDYFYTPYKPSCQSNQVKTLDDIAINFTKYIPKDNAVLFLSEEDKEKYCNTLLENVCIFSLKDLETWEFKYLNDSGEMETPKKATIFLSHGTESELKKVNEIAQELKEKHGIDEVNLFVLHLFKEITQFYEKIVFYSDSCLSSNIEDWHNLGNINKIITTNSMPQVFQKRLQILDCYDIFNDYLKGK